MRELRRAHPIGAARGFSRCRTMRGLPTARGCSDSATDRRILRSLRLAVGGPLVPRPRPQPESDGLLETGVPSNAALAPLNSEAEAKHGIRLKKTDACFGHLCFMLGVLFIPPD